jgi:hypothetical protein
MSPQRRAAVSTEEQEGGGNELWAVLAAVRGKDLEDPEVERIAAACVEHRDVGIPLLLELFRDPEEDAALLAIASVGLKRLEPPHPTRALLDLLRDPEVGPLAKALIMNILEKYGVNVDRPEIFGVGINLEDYQVEGGSGEGRRILRG